MTDIFVFGSNMQGDHEGGAAAFAVANHGAIMGKHFGIQGSSFAIPTLTRALGPNEPVEPLQLPRWRIHGYVYRFRLYAKRHYDDRFLVTALGTGIAGFTHDVMAQFFRNAPRNVLLPAPWHPILFGRHHPEWESFP
jgi:hypothetical protein